MAKGFFTQGACVLLSHAVTLEDIHPLLSELDVVKRIDAASNPDLGGPSFTVAFRPEVNGYVSVDLQDRRWPDHMGDPQNEPMLFGAWSMGHFGPFAFPGNLERATQQSWSWKGAEDAAARHQAFIRVRSSYIFGASDDARVIPDGYDPLAELTFVTRLCAALLRHPAALAYFNPNGETLRDRAGLVQSLDGSAKVGHPPVDVWSNVRLFNPGNGWLLMDTVGMAQLDRPDGEACFPSEDYEPRDVGGFLRNVALYLLDKGEVIDDGHTVDGPGGVRWRALHVEESLVSPSRRSLRFVPVDGSEPPPEMMRGSKQQS